MKNENSLSNEIPTRFSGTIFHRHWIQFESGALNTEFSNIYFFLPSTTDQIKDINRYMASVNLIPINIQENNLELEGGKFAPSKLDFDNSEKQKMREAVLKILRKVVDFSNSNFVKNTDGLLATRTTNKNIWWVGDTGQKVPKKTICTFLLIIFLRR